MKSSLEYNFENYDKRLISIFDVVGSYFVDILFNHIYNASKLHVSGNSSITDEYKRNVQAFIIEVKNNHSSYTKTISDLHKYFVCSTSYKTISFSQFIDNIVELVMPEEYFDSLNSEEKDEVLGSTICDLISSLGVYATSPDMLSRIIDHHDLQHQITIKILQQYAITLLLAKRDSIYNKFLKNIGQAKETVSIDLVENMRKVIRRLVKEKTELLAYIDKLERRARHKDDDTMQFKKVEARLRDKIEDLQAELDERRSEKKKSRRKSRSHNDESPTEKPDNVDFIEPEPNESKIDKEKFKQARLKLIEKRKAEELPETGEDTTDDDEEWTETGSTSASDISGGSLDDEEDLTTEHLKKSD
jgi:hypothetical protein